MADEQGQVDTSDNSTRTKKRVPLTPEEQRARKQQRFLKAFRETGNIKHSCKVAGLARSTFYEWRDKDESFAEQLADAELEANDTLEQAAYERAVQGVDTLVVSMGRVVYEEIPAPPNEDGTPKLDRHGEPLYVRGKPITERKYSDTLLITLLKARMPEKYKEKREHSGPNGGPIPIDFVTEWGGGMLNEEDEESEG